MTHFGKANAMVEAKRARIRRLKVYLTAQQRVRCRVEHVLLNRLIEQCSKSAVLMIGIDRNTVEINKILISFGEPAMVISGVRSIRRKRDTEGADFTMFVVYR